MKTNKKEELLNIAYNLFITKGYDNTSIDEIIKKADIAKGTYYYYFTSKEEMLDQIIDNMINNGIIKAKKYLDIQIPVEQKLIGIITSIRPKSDEVNIVEALNDEKNLKMHAKFNKKIVDEVTVLLKNVVVEAIDKGILDCDNIEERVRLLLIMSNEIFDHQTFSRKDIEVYIDTVEKILGAKKGSMNFIATLIGGHSE